MKYLLITFLLICAPAPAQDKATQKAKGKVEVAGFIYSRDGLPLQGVAILVMGIRRDCKPLKFARLLIKSDVQGRFTFTVPRGVDVRVRARGVYGLRAPVWLEVPDSGHIDFAHLKASQRDCGSI
jgi:hypothetical protein